MFGNKKVLLIAAIVIAVGGGGAYYYFMLLPARQKDNGATKQAAVKPNSPVPKGLPVIPATALQAPVVAPAVTVLNAPINVPATPQPVPAPVIAQPAPVPPPVPVVNAIPEPPQEPAPKSQRSASKKSMAETMSEPMDSQAVAPEKKSEITRSAPVAVAEPAPADAFVRDTESTVIKLKYNDVMTAVLHSDKGAVKQLLDLGYWVDKPGSDGSTPLMAAIMNKDTLMVQLLLEYGAVASSQALNLARRNKDAETASLLEQRGAR